MASTGLLLWIICVKLLSANPLQHFTGPVTTHGAPDFMPEAPDDIQQSPTASHQSIDKVAPPMKGTAELEEADDTQTNKLFTVMVTVCSNETQLGNETMNTSPPTNMPPIPATPRITTTPKTTTTTTIPPIKPKAPTAAMDMKTTAQPEAKSSTAGIVVVVILSILLVVLICAISFVLYRRLGTGRRFDLTQNAQLVRWFPRLQRYVDGKVARADAETGRVELTAATDKGQRGANGGEQNHHVTEEQQNHVTEKEGHVTEEQNHVTEVKQASAAKVDSSQESETRSAAAGAGSENDSAGLKTSSEDTTAAASASNAKVTENDAAAENKEDDEGKAAKKK